MSEAMKEKHLDAFMDTAYRFSELSTAIRAQVGAIIVKDRRIISIGYNGMPSGWDNDCEDREYMDRDAGGWLNPEEIEAQWPYQDNLGRYKLKTKPQVLHAEANAIAKLAQSPESARDSVLFCTHMPCMECAKLIHQSGIRTVYYGERYEAAKGSGEQFLTKSGIKLSWLPQKPKPIKTVEKIIEVERVVNEGKPLLFDSGKLMQPNFFYKILSRRNENKEIISVEVIEDMAFFHINAEYNWDLLYSDVLAVNKLFEINTWIIDYSYEAHILQADDQRKGFIFDIIHQTIRRLADDNEIANAEWNLIHGNYYVQNIYNTWCHNNKVTPLLNTVDHLPTLFFHRYYKNALRHYKPIQFRQNFDKTPVKHYCTFNGRAGYDRVGLLKYLSNNNLLDKGYSTWHFDSETWKILGEYNPEIVPLNALASGSQQPQDFTIISTDWNKGPEQDLIDAYRHSCFEIVVETITNIEQESYNWDSPTQGRTSNAAITDQVPDANTVFFTEKTARPLLWGMPFFLNAGYRSLAALRELGFETFGDLWDESYDEIVDPDARAERMHRSINTVLAQPLESLVEQITRIRERLKRNQQRYMRLAELKPVPLWIESHVARHNGHPTRRILSQLLEPNAHIRI